MGDFLEVLSSGLTVATIIMSILVVRHWRKSAMYSVRTNDKFTGEEWLILGVFIGFIGQSLDNFYWLLAWSSHYLNGQSTTTEWLFEHGVFFNIPFRQISGIAAAYFHVRAAIEYSKHNSSGLGKTTVLALIIGIMYSISLVLIK